MKRFILFFLCWPLEILCAMTISEAEQLLQQGDHHFSKEAYDQALDAYRSALQFRPSAQVYFNMGQIYAVQGKPGFALAYYLKAQRWNPRWELLQQALQQLYSENPQLAVVDNPWYHRWLAYLSWESWSWLCSLCFWCMCWLFLRAKMKHRPQKSYLLPILLLLMVCLLLTVLGLNRSYNRLQILPENTTAHFAPTDSSPARYQWMAGTPCWIQNEREGYFFVNTKNGEDGWVKKQDLISIY